jgi:hypothetical protein
MPSIVAKAGQGCGENRALSEVWLDLPRIMAAMLLWAVFDPSPDTAETSRK